jgi:hypothetical protein
LLGLSEITNVLEFVELKKKTRAAAALCYHVFLPSSSSDDRCRPHVKT